MCVCMCVCVCVCVHAHVINAKIMVFISYFTLLYVPGFPLTGKSGNLNMSGKSGKVKEF